MKLVSRAHTVPRTLGSELKIAKKTGIPPPGIGEGNIQRARL